MKDKPIILVVDDEPKNRELIRARLMPMGYQIIEAIDGEDAINKTKEFAPDLILLDVMMPNKNGFEVCRILKARLETLFVPIIIVTALSGREDRIKGIEAGADDFLSKPIDAQELIARVKSLLRIKTQRDEITRISRELADARDASLGLTKLLLKTSESRFKVLFESSSDALMNLAPPDWRFTDCNPATLKMFGVKDEMEFVLRAHWEWSPERQSDGQLSFVKSQEMIDEAMKTGSNLFEWTHKRMDGEEFNTDVLLTRMEIKGEKLLQATVRDITERKKAQELLVVSEVSYRRLFEAARDGILILDAQTGQIVDVNKFLIDLLGFSREQFLGKKIWGIGFFKDIVSNKENFEELQRKGYMRYEDLPLETAAGKRIEVEFVSNVYDVGGKKVIQCNIRDITERKKIEAQLFQAQKLDSIGTLAGGVAHDFNNMLGAIRGFAELSMMDIDKSNPVYEYLKHIVASTDRAGNLTRQLLIFSKGQSAELNPLNLNENVNNMLKMLTRLISENIKIETNFTPDISTIKADAGNIEQVLMNLVVNARDAMPKGGLIEIKTENLSIDEEYRRLHIESHCGNFVCLIITDTGIGMTKEVLSHIFEPFYTTKPQGKGTGLGLAVVYGIVKKHNGWVNVYSEPGQGSVFKVYLPALAEKALSKPDTKILLTESLKGKSERILVIEDDEGIRELITNALAKMKYRVFVASSGAQARAIFNREKGDFRIILSDVVLPDTNGIDLCDELVNDNPGILVLLSSGYASKGTYTQVISERGLPFISKPYNLLVLFQKMRDMLESKQFSKK